MAKVIVSSGWKGFTGGDNTFELDAQTAEEAINAFMQQHPQLRLRVFTEDGRLASFVAIFVDDEQIVSQRELGATISPSTVIRIIPALVGG
jgi:adenylyltransferase/sulfurtransferase